MAVRTLIIDGLWGRPRRWRGLQRLIEQRCGPAAIYEYDASGCVPFEVLGEQLAQEIRRHDGPVNLVGFSMGGVVARAAHLVDPTLPVRRAALLNSPHQGSWLAYLLPLAGIRQMRPSSAFMARLREHTWSVPTLVVWNAIDQMVIPGSSTRWNGACAEAKCSVPLHLWPIWSTAIHERVADFLASDEEQASVGLARATAADRSIREAS